MNKESEDKFEALRHRDLTRGELMHLTSAIEQLAKAISGHSTWDSLRCVRNTFRDLEEFRGAVLPVPDLTADEANMSAALHTYMRKGMDCDLGTMLHRLISENRGTRIWYAFVKAVNANDLKRKFAYRNAIQAAEDAYHVGSDTTDDLLMLSVLRMWKDDFDNALTWAKDEE